GAAVDILEVDHDRLAVLDRDLADVGTHRGLMIDGAIGEWTEWAVDLEAAERRDQLVGLGRARLGDSGRKRLDGDVADHRAEPRIIVEALLIRGQEGFVLGRADRVPRIAGDDPTDGGFVLERVEIFGLARELAGDEAVLEHAAR